MSPDTPRHRTPTSQTVETAVDNNDSGTESIGDCHRMAAYHFAAAAKHHLAAGASDDEGLDDAAAHHAFLAYRHQLNGVQYAEIAVMDSETLDDVEDEMQGDDNDNDEDDEPQDAPPR